MKRTVQFLIGVIVAVVALGALFMYERGMVTDIGASLRSDNQKIKALQDERAELVAELDKLGVEYVKPWVAEEVAQQETAPTRSIYPVTLTFTNIDERFYSEVFSLMQEKGLKGTMVFGSGELPGDAGFITYSEFLEVTDAGWTLGLYYPAYAGIDDWAYNMAYYVEASAYGATGPAKAYWFADAPTEGEVEGLINLGFTQALNREEGTYNGLTGIRMIPYMNASAEELALLTGPVTLEVNMGYEAPAGTSYSQSALKTLLESNYISVKNPGDATNVEEVEYSTGNSDQESQSSQSSDGQGDSDAEDIAARRAEIEARIAEIDEELERLYH